MSEMARRAASLFEHVKPDCHLVFHHVPKTGGTSVGSAMRRRFPFSHAGFDQNAAYKMVEALYPQFDRTVLFSDEYLRFRREYFLHLLARDVQCITGHFPFDEVAYDRFGSKYHFVTILRPPVARFISHYFDSHLPTPDPERPFAITESLGDLLESERGRRMGRIYTEFFSGLFDRQDLSSTIAIDSAKANLEHFSLVGFLENTEDFSRRLLNDYGLRIKLRHLRRGPTSNERRQALITPDIEDRIRTICSSDIEIYTWALERFSNG